MYEAEVTLLVETYIGDDLTTEKGRKEVEETLRYRLELLLKDSDEEDENEQ